MIEIDQANASVLRGGGTHPTPRAAVHTAGLLCQTGEDAGSPPAQASSSRNKARGGRTAFLGREIEVNRPTTLTDNIERLKFSSSPSSGKF